MIDRSYLPYQSAREHRDRGRAKWMGFFLSEHTTSLDEDKKRVDLSSPLSKIEKLTLVGQLYASRLTGRFVIKQDKKRTGSWPSGGVIFKGDNGKNYGWLSAPSN